MPTTSGCAPQDAPLGAFLECRDTYIDADFDTRNLTWSAFKLHFHKSFTAVVIDCEGCYEGLLRDVMADPAVRLVSIEWDGRRLDEELEAAGFVQVGSLPHMDLGADAVATYVRPTSGLTRP